MKKITEMNHLFQTIKQLIEDTKKRVSVSVNSSLTLMYWHIGKQIDQEILKSKRAEYGKEIIVTLSKQLSKEYGRGYSKRNLLNMVKFYKTFTDKEIVQTLSAYLSWSHFNELVSIEDNLK